MELRCESSSGILEKCGRWLLSIPRDDIKVLRKTVEFQEFLRAFETLGDAHRRVIVDNSSNVIVPVDKKKKEIANSTNLCGSNSKSNEFRALVNRESLYNVLSGVDQRKKAPQRRKQLLALPLVDDSNIISRTNSNHFLRFTDDVLLRIFEFLRCQSLIQASFTCSRFYELARKSSVQRTYDIAHARQLGNNFLLLRAREQIYYVDDTDEQRNDPIRTGNNNITDINYGNAASNNNFHVPVPTLLPGRRVLVEHADDPEFNGIYYATDANGNGFVFTKPRFSSHRASLQVQVQHQLEDMVLDDDENNNNFPLNDQLQQMNHDVVIPIIGGHLMNDDDEDNNNQLQQQNHYQHDDRPLRCIIAKAYSNNDVLWYMSKEVERLLPCGTVRKKNIYSFYAPLMLSGNTRPELCTYPSQSSALVRQNQSWRALRGNVRIRPTLEVIDQDDLHT
mmetsp:Transcript_28239/g.30412  ORF Transcript_28239/g.30412 Transcript_28239/m.30412 type:complete len:449 (+) Transcript_28239:68-1414(+)